MLATVALLAVLISLPLPSAAQVYPTVTLTIVRIQEIDSIDGFGGDWDWFYWIGVYDGAWTWNRYEAPNGQDVTVNAQHTFTARSASVTFAITLCEGDTFSNDDVADISSSPSAGYDDSASNCTPSGSPFAGSFVGTWSLTSEALSGDSTVSDPQGRRTSGDFDGSTGIDENDANLWFTIRDNYAPPVANAGPDKSGTTGSIFSFDGTSSTASSGSSIEFYAWDFTGDLVTDLTGPIVSWTFNAVGTYTVTLTVTDSLDVTDSDTAVVTIQNRAPTAAFAFSPTSPTIKDVITFADTSTDPDGTIASWSWDFGDGATSTIPNPTHQYSTNGPKSVTLTVTDNGGQSASVTRAVNVVNIDPTAAFTHTPQSVTTEDVVQFNDASTDEDGTIASWSWDFGDGTSATGSTATHKFATPGTYDVTLTVTDDDGSTSPTTQSITVTAGLPGGNVAGIPVLLIPILLIAVIVVAVLIALRRRKVQPGPPAPPTSPPR